MRKGMKHLSQIGLWGLMLALWVACTPEDEMMSGTHPRAVDLGLSVKWASCDVGAASPEEPGQRFGWGSLTPHEGHDLMPPQHEHWTGDFILSQPYEALYDNANWSHIGNDIRGSKHDVASVEWGENWRMPTKDEFEELQGKCTWERTRINEVHGMKATGPNGNSIFFPFLYLPAKYNVGYWSSTLSDDEYGAYAFSVENHGANVVMRHQLLLVRPVKKSSVVVEEVDSTRHRAP